MQTINELSDDDGIEPGREIIRMALNEVTNDVGSRLREAGLSHPVFVIVPNSGDAITIIGTPADPSDDDWNHTTKIIREIVSQRLGGMKLRSRELICSAANATIAAAEVTAD